jgi:hypothetical protein
VPIRVLAALSPRRIAIDFLSTHVCIELVQGPAGGVGLTGPNLGIVPSDTGQADKPSAWTFTWFPGQQPYGLGSDQDRFRMILSWLQ